MKNYKYIIVGGGMASDSAVDGIRELDQSGTILMVSAESEPPYNRPPLSKALWKNMPMEKIWRKTDEKNVDILLNTKVVNIDQEEYTISTNKGEKFHFEKLLLATGGKTRKLPFGGHDILYFRTLADFKMLYEMAAEKKDFAVIGSGFIGSELAAALAMNGKNVTIFDIGPGIGWNIFPEDMITFLNNYYQQKGVQVITNIKVIDVTNSGKKFLVELNNGKTYEVDGVVAGIGVMPDTALAESLELKVDNGIHVNDYLQTTNPKIFAAGDAANFYNPLLAKRIRVEHADNATAMGKAAGRNMAGAGERYDYLPFFYSDLFDLGYEAVGLLGSRCELVADWQKKYEKGVLYYLEDNRVTGVLLWNVWDKIDQAKAAIVLPVPVKKEQLLGSIK